MAFPGGKSFPGGKKCDDEVIPGAFQAPNMLLRRTGCWLGGWKEQMLEPTHAGTWKLSLRWITSHPILFSFHWAHMLDVMYKSFKTKKTDKVGTLAITKNMYCEAWYLQGESSTDWGAGGEGHQAGCARTSILAPTGNLWGLNLTKTAKTRNGNVIPLYLS